MKTNTQKSIHQKIEQLLRSQPALYLVLGFILLGLVRMDSRVIKVMREAYAQGFGMIGMYLREETARSTPSLAVIDRTPTISGR